MAIVGRPSVNSDIPGIAVRNAHRVVVGTMLASYTGMLVFLNCQTSPTKAETAHMAAGVYTWNVLNFDVFHVNPPLVRAVATIPVVLCGPVCDWSKYSPVPSDRSEFDLGGAFYKANGERRSRWYFFLARCACIPFALLGAVICYRLAGEIFGVASGFCALTLWCFSPALLGSGATICPDLAAGAVGIAAISGFRRWLLVPDWPHALTAGVLLGLLPLTKLTWLIAYVLWPVLWFLCRLAQPQRGLSTKRVQQLGMMLGVGIFVTNSGYVFQGSFRRLGDYRFVSKTLSGVDNSVRADNAGPPVTGNRFVGTWVGAVPVPLPAEFVQGVDTQRYDFERGLPSYLRGQWADHGWWYYYLYALAVKEPLGNWCLVVLAVGVTIFARGNSAWCDEMLVVAPGLAVVIFVSCQTGFSAHSRYIIPALPFFFVWTSKVGRVFGMCPFTRWRHVFASTVVAAMTWSVGSSLTIFPHSLSYFNELTSVLSTPGDMSYPKPLRESDHKHNEFSAIRRGICAGPRNGPRHLLDSNIDWGQDLFFLKKWLDKHSDVKLDGLAFDNSYPATLAGIPETPRPPTGFSPELHPIRGTGADFSLDERGPRPGWYALSVNYIYSREREYRYFLNFRPVALAGYSIYIYKIELDEANRVRKDLGLPELTRGDGEREAKNRG